MTMQTIEVLCGDHDDPEVNEVRHAVEVLPGLFVHRIRAIDGEMKATPWYDFTHGPSGYRIPMIKAREKSQIVAIINRLDDYDFTQPMDDLVDDDFRAKIYDIAEALDFLVPLNRDRKEKSPA